MESNPAELQSARPEQRALPDLAKYVGKEVDIKLKDKRRVQGVLSGYDNRMNVVVEEWKEIPRKSHSDIPETTKETAVIRGSAIEDIQLRPSDV